MPTPSEHDRRSATDDGCDGAGYPDIRRGLAGASRALADRAADATLRTQLNALAAVADFLASEGPHFAERAAVESEIARAMATGDEATVLAACVVLAQVDRSSVPPVAWSALSDE